MLEIVGIILGTVTAAIFGLWAVFKVFLPKFIDIAISRLQHSQNQELKQLESRLELHSTALFNSMNIASRIEDTYRMKTIDATSALWKEFLRIKNEFAPLVAFESILTEDEFLSVMTGSYKKTEDLSAMLADYSSFQRTAEKLAASSDTVPTSMPLAFGTGAIADRLHETRIFVSERLFTIYNCMIRVHGRLGFLVSQSMKSGEGRSWRRDPVMEEIVLSIFPREVWEQVARLKFGGLRSLIALLEQQFIVEAKKSMRGFEKLADTVAEVSQITQEEEARARLRRDYF